MKRSKICAVALALVLMLTACSTTQNGSNQNVTIATDDEMAAKAIEIRLSDDEIKINGVPAETNPENSIYIGNDIVYYEEGKDLTYGEGSDKDAHSAEVAAEHTVVHITKPGIYSISGYLTKGQIAVDLGDDAEENPEAVVTLILNGTDITCEVAPAIIFYNVYECGSADTDNASKDVDTSFAGANVIIADGTTNTINGSYVARIYKPDTVVLNESGTEVEDAKKLHKYDGAFYSKMSMNVSGESENSGILTINAENEGLDSELHLTINGGIIHINSGNDGINTNEDGVSVTTINGGEIYIQVTGETGEGDGIDSNGWLVINGGTVTAQACSFSGDAGIDSDMGIHINGGTVIATGHMLDQIEDGGQNYVVFTFAEKQSGCNTISLKDKSGYSVLEAYPINDYSILIYSSSDLVAGTYTMWSNGVQMTGRRGGMMDRPGMSGMTPDGDISPERPTGQAPNDTMPPEPPEDQMTNGSMPPEIPEGTTPPDDGQIIGGQNPPEGMGKSEGGSPVDRPDGPWKPDNRNDGMPQELTIAFQIFDGGNMFQGVSRVE